MSEPTAALQAVRASTADLLEGVADEHWSDADLRAASLCDGWTRGHVLTHLARNADGTAATLAGALRGEIVPRYPSGAAGRAADIERGSSRSFEVLLADVAESAERLDRVFGAVSEANAWDAPTDEGRLAAEWVSRRLCEVEVHRVDLAGSYGPDRWPALLVTQELPALAETVPENLRRTVSGPDWALLACFMGRGASVSDRLGDLPSVPAWR